MNSEDQVKLEDVLNDDDPIKPQDVLNDDDHQMADNVQEMRCPACGAPISLDEGIEAVICEYCGTKVFVDDEIYKYNRILKAQTEAKHREAKAQFELEKEKETYEARRDALNAYKEKPVETTAVTLCTVWLIAQIINGHVGLAHVVIEFIVIIWAMGPEKRPQVFTEMGLHLKHNKGHAVVFVISLIVMLASITNGLYMGLFLFSLGGMIWSVKTGNKVELPTDDDTNYVYVRNSAIYYREKPYKEVMEEFQACGFSDIVTIQKRDLIKGWLTKAGSVNSISINGDQSFSEGQEYPSDAKVIIEYHEFK